MPGIQFGVDNDAEGFLIKGSSQCVLTMLSFPAVVGTPFTILTAGEVFNGLTITYMVFSNTIGAVQGGTVGMVKPLAGTTTLVVTLSVGNSVTFTIATDGSMTVVRSAGTASYLVSVLILYS